MLSICLSILLGAILVASARWLKLCAFFSLNVDGDDDYTNDGRSTLRKIRAVSSASPNADAAKENFYVVPKIYFDLKTMSDNYVKNVYEARSLLDNVRRFGEFYA